MRVFFFCCFLFLHTFLHAQEKVVSFTLQEQPILVLLHKIESSFDVRFSYNDDLLIDKNISYTANNETLLEIITNLNKTTELYFEIISERNIIILPSDPNTINSDFEEQVLNEIILKNYLTKGIHKQKDGSFKISPKELKILPGLTEPDVFQSLQLLPGIVSPEETSTDIHVRGGSPDQNLILWDNVKIYHSGHLFGTFSAFNPYITDAVEFINKGTDAKYGDRVSSVIAIQTNNEIASNFSGGIGINGIEANTYFETPIIKDKLSILMSIRRSYTDIYATNTYEKLTNKVFQNTTTKSILSSDSDFYYFDYNFKVNWKLDDNNTINFSYIKIENELDDTLKEPDFNRVYKDKLETENFGFSLNWNKKWNQKFSHEIHAYQSKFNLLLYQSDELLDIEKNVFEKSNEVADLGVNFNITYQISDYKKLTGGYHFSNNQVKYSLSNSNSLNDNQILNSHALFATYHYKNEELFDLNAGIRMNYYSLVNQLELEPRINLFKKLSPNWNLNITAERKTQAISQINETISNSLTLENQFWALSSDDTFPVVRSVQLTGGFSFTKNNWQLELDTYFKEISGLTTLNIGFIDIDDFSFKEGESKVKGMDFYLKKQFDNYKTWVSYTLSSVKNHFEEVNEGASFPANTDIVNNFYWSHEYSFKQFHFALGWRWHTGKPYSKPEEIIVDDQGNETLFYKEINSFRLPNYKRLDFSSTYVFDISKRNNIQGTLGISVLNIFNTQNILNRSYSINSIDNEINTIDTKSLERVTNFVFRLTW